MYDVLIVGCGLCGMVVARELADKGKKVHIIERRNHIGGNIYDYRDENGVLVQKYGPHVFFTDDESIEKYITRFTQIDYFYPECRTYISGKAIPIPFNFASIDLLYSDLEAAELKELLISEFAPRKIVSVLDVVNSKIPQIHKYGQFMYENEYRKYSAKQWGRPIEEIEPSVFMRVPVYLSYDKAYLRNKYQYMPEGGFTRLAQRIIEHENIKVTLNCDALNSLTVDADNGKVWCRDIEHEIPVIYTGPLDALFGYCYGYLPYRALEFVWKTVNRSKVMETPLSAFPEGDKYIRITDYAQFPPQESGEKSIVAIEFPLEYDRDSLCGNEPYYPTLTNESSVMIEKYMSLASRFSNLYPCGRLADFKYYNMDKAILRAFEVCEMLSADHV